MPESEYLSPIIDDGQNRTSVIPAKPGLYSAVQIRWRKLDADSIDIVAARAAADPGSGFCRHYAQQLAKHNVVDWDIKDSKGNKVPVKALFIRKSESDFYNALVAVCEGRKPEWEIPPRKPAETAKDEEKNS